MTRQQAKQTCNTSAPQQACQVLHGKRRGCSTPQHCLPPPPPQTIAAPQLYRARQPSHRAASCPAPSTTAHSPVQQQFSDRSIRFENQILVSSTTPHALPCRDRRCRQRTCTKTQCTMQLNCPSSTGTDLSSTIALCCTDSVAVTPGHAASCGRCAACSCSAM